MMAKSRTYTELEKSEQTQNFQNIYQNLLITTYPHLQPLPINLIKKANL